MNKFNEIYNRYKNGETDLAELGKEYGVTKERIRQVIFKMKKEDTEETKTFIYQKSLTFKSPQEMLNYIQSGHDLYSKKTETYVWLYNQSGGIAVATIDEKTLIKLCDEMKKHGDDTLIFEKLQGRIYDDPSYEYATVGWHNIDYCSEHINDEWVDVKTYFRREKNK